MSTAAVDAMIEALCVHLKKEVPELCEALNEFPEANQELQYPSVSVFSKNPDYASMMSWEHSRVAVPGSSPARWLVRYVVGQYDPKVQLDLWCENKAQRKRVHEAVFKALNPQVDIPGLVLPLPEYYDLHASYDLAGFNLPDVEETAQRREWRATIQLLCNVKAVLEKEESSMTTIETTLETPDTI